MSQTTYAETECLLAVMNGDHQRAKTIAESLTAREQRTLIDNLRETIDIVAEAAPEVP